MNSDRIDIASGGLAAIPVTVVRREFNGPIDLQIMSPAGIRGHAVVPAGALTATLFAQASDEMPVGAYLLQGRASANIGGRIVVQPARIRAQVMAALSGLPFPPQNLLDSAGVAVTEKSPFAIRFRIDAAEAVRGKPIPVIVELASGKPAETDIKLASVGLPAKITAAMPVLTKGQKSVKGTISAAADSPVGEHEFTIVGTSSVGGREFQALAPPATLSLKAKTEAVPAKP